MKNKNLYQIIVAHSSPKDTHESIQGYIIAANDEKVYNYIDKKLTYGWWSEIEEEYQESLKENYIDEGAALSDYHKSKILKERGDLNDESGFDDAFYGVTKYGWKQIKVGEDIKNIYFKLLKNTKVAKEI